ncbi:MAG: hypothetical protein ABIF10_06595 [Candidatus Woesearchaeota archaeon]
MYLLDENFVVPQAKADSLLAAGRLTKNKSLVCGSVALFKRFNTTNPEEKAIIYETIASLGCGAFRPYYYWKAARIWRQINNDFRSRLDLRLALGLSPEIRFDPFVSIDSKDRYNAEKIVIGKTGIAVTNSDLLLAQSDRVTRDWYGFQLNDSPFSSNLLTVFSERLYYPADELTTLGWHEGGRLNELVGIRRKIAVGTLIAEMNGTWYAPDENGIFRFSVPMDKALYPTNRFLREDLLMVVDTHGVNMQVEQALRYNATVVVGCCDYPGKVDAAKYLATKNVKVVCFTDRFLPDLIGQDLSIVGSPPIRKTEKGFVIGAQVVEIDVDEIVVAQGVANYSVVQQYYDTPARYFAKLHDMTGINVVFYNISSTNQTQSLFNFAESANSSVVALRVFSKEDYKAASSWLGKNENNRLILFHSSPYPYGYRLFFEFPVQTSFDDINPLFV